MHHSARNYPSSSHPPTRLPPSFSFNHSLTLYNTDISNISLEYTLHYLLCLVPPHTLFSPRRQPDQGSQNLTYKLKKILEASLATMAAPMSSGKPSTLSYEQKGRMTWDPAYRAKHQDVVSSSESSDEDDVSAYEGRVGPYVSGGLPAGQRAANDSITRSGVSIASQGDRGHPSARQNGLDQDGFQRVSRKRTRPMPRRTNLHFNRDNEAKAAYRRREPPSGHFILPRDCNEIEPSLIRMYDFLEELGVRVGSFIRPPQHIRDRTIDLWGNAEVVARAQAEIRNWLNPLTRATAPIFKGKENFASVTSAQGDKFKRMQRNIALEAEKKKFQQLPDSITTFAYNGSFLWPVNEIQPTVLLGAGLEALDPLRLKFKCHIIFDTKQSVFKVLTNKEESVEKTLVRFEGIMKEYVARFNRPIVKFYIDPPSPVDYRKEIHYVPTSASLVIPLMTGEHLEFEAHDKWRRQTANLLDQSDRGIEDAMRKTIPNLRFYRGNIRMRVHYGTFALTRYRRPDNAETIVFEEFMRNMATQGTKGTMLREQVMS